MDALSEIGDAGGETDRMNVLSNVQEFGGTGETGWMDALSEVVEESGEKVRLNVLSAIADAGDNGGADWMEAHLEYMFEKICKQSGVFDVPKISSQG